MVIVRGLDRLVEVRGVGLYIGISNSSSNNWFGLWMLILYLGLAGYFVKRLNTPIEKDRMHLTSKIGRGFLLLFWPLSDSFDDE